MPRPSAPPVLDADNVRFVQGGVSIILASRDAANRPNLVRALGCRVDRDGRRVTVFVAASQAAALLDDLRGNGRIAAVFTQPTTHRSLQLKGSDAVVARLRRDDRPRLAAYGDAMVVELEQMGVSEAHTRSMLACEPDDVLAVSFTPAAAFVQTPGPDAGAPLGTVPCS